MSKPRTPLVGADEPWWLRVGKHTLCNRLAKGRWLCAFQFFWGVCACPCVHMSTCMCVLVCTYLCVQGCVCVCVCVCICIDDPVCMCM